MSVRKVVRLLILGIAGGIAAGASAALLAEEFLLFSPVPSNLAYVLLVLIGLGMGFLVKGMQEGLLLGVVVALMGTITLFLSLYWPNIEIGIPEFILRSVWWGGLTIFFLTLIGIFVGRIFSGE
ncbi:MAG: hypothetical protein N3E42_02025 [Candidatus Bipolaricaulota bacterium]|nr:hypothetical protein [Candidatus Bipolaricaulota bacterium]